MALYHCSGKDSRQNKGNIFSHGDLRIGVWLFGGNSRFSRPGGNQKIQTIKQCSDDAELNPTFKEEEYRKMAALPLAATERSVAFSERVGVWAFTGQGDIRLPGVLVFPSLFR
jgi:hypothetical protein